MNILINYNINCYSHRIHKSQCTWKDRRTTPQNHAHIDKRASIKTESEYITVE